VGEFGAMSVPQQDHVVEAFYRGERRRCPNVNYRGIQGDLLDRVRTRANGKPDDAPLADVLLEFCARP
jgi:hypothetical protein